jgi:hypothetical protein
MRSKELTIDFFKLTMPQGVAPFHELLKKFVDDVSFAARKRESSGHIIRLTEAHFANDVIEGDFTKIRMYNLPEKGCISGPDQPLELSDEEGLSAGRAFYYYVPWEAVAIQRNGGAPTIGEIENYLHDTLALPEFPEFEPVLQRSAYRKLHEMQEVKRFEIKVAGLNNAALLAGEGHGLGQILDLLKFLQAPTASIEASVGGRRGKSLWIGLKDVAQRLGKLGKEHPSMVKTVRLRGLDGDGESQLVDLLLDPLQQKVSVIRERRTPYASRRTAVYDGFKAKRDELKVILGPST